MMSFTFAINTNSSVELNVIEFECGDISEDLLFPYDLYSEGDCFIVVDSNITINCNGHSLIGNGSGSGIFILSKDNIEIINCTIANFTEGVSAGESNNLLINTSIFYNNTNGITIDNGQFKNVYNNTFYNNDIAISDYSYFIDPSDDYFYNNHIYNNDIGIKLENLLVTSLTNNSLHNNTIGIELNNVEDLLIINNTFNQSKNLYLNNIESSYVYYNEFYNGSTYHINATDLTDVSFNTSVLGIAQGNYIDDASDYILIDENTDGFHDSGVDYAYRAEAMPKWIGEGTDWGTWATELINTSFGENITGLYYKFHFSQYNISIPIYNVDTINQTEINPFLVINSSDNISMVMRINTSISPLIFRVKCNTENDSSSATILESEYARIGNIDGDGNVWCWADVLDPRNLKSFSLDWWAHATTRGE
jgi:hypothetical protein